MMEKESGWKEPQIRTPPVTDKTWKRTQGQTSDYGSRWFDFWGGKMTKASREGKFW